MQRRTYCVVDMTGKYTQNSGYWPASQLCSTQSVQQKNIGYYFDSMDYRRYSTAVDAQHTDGKLRVLRVYWCADHFCRRQCG